MDAVNYLIEGIKLEAMDDRDTLDTLVEIHIDTSSDFEGFLNSLKNEIAERSEALNLCPHCQEDLICEIFTEERGEYFGTPVTDRVGETRCPNGCI